MELNEYISSYRGLALKKKAMLLFFIAILPGLYDMWDSGQELIETKESTVQAQQAAIEKFEHSKKRKEELPALEKKLAETEVEMENARKALPDDFLMDQILEKTSILAEDVGVRLTLFDPGEPLPSNTAFKYVELPIKLEAHGSFGEIASFFDRLVHLDLLVHVRDVRINIASQEAEKIESKLSSEEQQRMMRENTKLVAACEMVIFRTLSDAEARAIEQTDAQIAPSAATQTTGGN